jgi:hypothetical protein
MVIWFILLPFRTHILWPFGIFCCHFGTFSPFFGMLYQEKSGNPDRNSHLHNCRDVLVAFQGIVAPKCKIQSCNLVKINIKKLFVAKKPLRLWSVSRSKFYPGWKFNTKGSIPVPRVFISSSYDVNKSCFIPGYKISYTGMVQKLMHMKVREIHLRLHMCVHRSGNNQFCNNNFDLEAAVC